MSSPPQTPSSHRRRPSSISVNSQTPTRGHRRRSSAAAYSPITPRSTHRPGSIDHSYEDGIDENSALHESTGGVGSIGNGLGSLADELADAEEYDDDEDIEDGEEFEAGMGGASSPVLANGTSQYGTPARHHRQVSRTVGGDSGIDVSTSTTTSSPASKPEMLSPESTSARSKSNGRGSRHRRQRSVYDGSDYGDDSDLEASEGFSAGLESRLADVESLVRRGTEENGSASDGVVQRVIEDLRDLGGQVGVEGGATRLSTAHNSLTTHLSHQTRLLTSLTSTLFSPLSIPPSPALLDEILPLLTQLLTSPTSSLPYPSTKISPALYSLSTSTASLLNTLSSLSDTLQLSRQTTTSASRSLRNTQQVLAELQKEMAMAEEGRRWIERGGWEQRLRERGCARECREVVGGFEEVCRGWRERLEGGVGTI
ncbi:MAG: hypothetical protein M1820_006074 [Bogoriella megaspora]|nr:MAG: hypothetical protein M1820_006074 [Bogoriella megaspora]